jgi:ATP phosphoribosyltransferase regulatory subunit
MLCYTADKRQEALKEAQRLRRQGRVVITRLIASEAEMAAIRQQADGDLICLTEREESR